MKMRRYQRIFTIVIDSLGIGEASDAANFGDAGTNTFVHIWENQRGLRIPNLERLGLTNLCEVSNCETVGYRARLQEASAGKDTMTGHWEMMGLYIEKPFRTFTEKDFLRNSSKN